MMKLVFVLAFLFCIANRKGKRAHSANRTFGASQQSTPAQRVYTTPSGTVNCLFEDMLNQTHVLIAGCAGSGKSVAVNGVIHNILHRFPSEDAGGIGLILIDPKRVELSQYRSLPHTMYYAGAEPKSWIGALNYACQIIERRYKDMERRGLRRYDGGDVYVIIDELADMMFQRPREVEPLLQHIMVVGRAAGVHVIGCTQCPLRAVLRLGIRENFDARLALRTSCKQDSINILGRIDGFDGTHTYPQHGIGYYRTPGFSGAVKIPYVPEPELCRVVNHWRAQAAS